MKTLVKNYVFNKASKQITFTSLDSIDLEQILLITNVVTNTIIYNFSDPSAGGSVLGNVLTLDYDTSSMNDTDELQIFIDMSDSDNTKAILNTIVTGMEGIMSQLQSIKKSQGIPDPAGRVRVLPEGGSVGTVSTVTTVSTVSSVSNIAAIGSFTPQQMVMSQTNMAWGNLRSKIGVS